MTIEKIAARLAPGLEDSIKQAKRRDRHYVFYIDAQTRDFGFAETCRTGVYDLQRMTHSDWVYSDAISIGGWPYTIIKGVKGDDSPDYKLTAIDAQCNPRICESFVITGRGIGDWQEYLTREDMDTILSSMRAIIFDDGLKCEVLMVD